MGKIVIIADAWGAKLGGINSFNFDICTALGKVSARYGVDVICVTMGATEAEIKEAKENGVSLISIEVSKEGIKPHRAYEIVGKIKNIYSGEVLWWIGHDVFTGEVAMKCKVLSEQGASAVIHHMSYAAYYSLKSGSGEEAMAKKKEQEKVLQNADRVFAVGPKLKASAENLREQKDVIELIPGLADIKIREEKFEPFSVVVFGRLEKSNDLIKQHTLAIKAFAQAVRREPHSFGNDPVLHVIGLGGSDNDQYRQECQAITAMIAKEAGRAINVIPQLYSEDRYELFDTLRKQDVCMMPSWHEGFGLVGMEAISAGVPLIITKNSGLYMTIYEIIGRKGTGCVFPVEILGDYNLEQEEDCVSPDDLENVVECLLTIARKWDAAKQGAIDLKNLFIESGYTWENTSEKMLNALNVDAEATDKVLISPTLKMASSERKMEEGKKESKQSSRSSEIRNVSQNFIGRQTDLEKFEKAVARLQPIVIIGIGGVGKTEFAYKCIEKFFAQQKVEWFECATSTNLDLIIEFLYPEFLGGMPKTTQMKCIGFRDLLERDGVVLFVDNYHEMKDAAFGEFLQFCNGKLRSARIVFISRELPADYKVDVSRVVLTGLKAEAVEYAEKILEQWDASGRVNRENLENLCKNLEGHPLAIKLALKLIVDRGEKAEVVINRLLEDKMSSEELSGKLIDEVLYKNANCSQDIKDYMCRFSIFSGRIERAIVDAVLGCETPEILYDKLMITATDDWLETHPLIREFSYRRLENKAIWHGRAAECYESYRKSKPNQMLEEKIIYHMMHAEKYDKLAGLIVEKGEEFIKCGFTDLLKNTMDNLQMQGVYKEYFQLIYGQIDSIEGRWSKATERFKELYENCFDDLNLKSDAVIKYGEMCYQTGNIAEAMACFKEGKEFAEKENHIKNIALALNNIGRVMESRGDLPGALAKYEASLALREELGDKSGIAISLNNIGGVMQSRGDWSGAMAKYEASLALLEELGDKSGIATSLNNIAGVMQSRGDWSGALAKYEASLALLEELGDKSGIASSLNNIAGVMQSRGDLPGAMAKYEASLALREELGDKSRIATSLNNIGLVMKRRGEWLGALAKYEASLALREELGDKSGIATSLNNIGLVMESQGDLPGALAKFEASLVLEEELGDKSGIAITLNNIGGVMQSRGDLSGALAKFETSLALLEELGDKSGIANSLNNIGGVMQSRGDLPGALAKVEASLALLEELGDKSGIANSLNNIGMVMKSRGDLPGALAKFEASLALLEELGDKSGIANSLNNIGGIMKSRGDLPGALAKFEASLALGEELGDKSGIATSLNNIGGIMKNRGDLSGALAKFEASLILREEMEDKSGIATLLNNIGGIYAHQKNDKKALEKRLEALAIARKIEAKVDVKIIFDNIILQKNRMKERGNYAQFVLLITHAFRELNDELKQYVDVAAFTRNNTTKIRKK
ncbi:tetratricopeptide repeat protein [Azotosporobacter soli]|uniref:tetratricopeptide repeat protein n=1 Tax=Azotosporobacter soli TaxID=3055040 RepID=UPI0031FEF279